MARTHVSPADMMADTTDNNLQLSLLLPEEGRAATGASVSS
ncbi:hypothetical protein [Xenorhabdus nematophila]|nr:hypothetical protein [Xenorhabdus nematophila]CEF31301.1 hypothetical protein XNW1_3310005 [Xenorhabdus nematophila str. Websteri]